MLSLVGAVGATDIIELIVSVITGFFTAIPAVIASGFEGLAVTGTGETQSLSLFFIYLTCMFAIGLFMRLFSWIIGRIRGN